MTLADRCQVGVEERAPPWLAVPDSRADPRRGYRRRHRDLQHRVCRPDQAAASRRSRPRHPPLGPRRCPFAAGRRGLAAGSACVAGQPERLHRDRTVRIGQLGGVARHSARAAISRRAERGAVGRAAPLAGPHDRSRSATATSSSARMRQLLVAAQLAAVVVLLTAAGLFIRSFTSLLRLDLGFDPRGVSAVPSPSSQSPLLRSVVRGRNDDH